MDQQKQVLHMLNTLNRVASKSATAASTENIAAASATATNTEQTSVLNEG